MKKLCLAVMGAAFALTLTACGPTATQISTPDGQKLDGDRSISGKITGDAVGAETKIALFGAFVNLSGNKIDATNQTIEEDTTLAVQAVSEGKYAFALPKAPQKAGLGVANLRLFAFNDANNNNRFDEGELKSPEGSVRYAPGIGYRSAQDADGNEVAVLTDEFKDFDFKLNK